MQLWDWWSARLDSGGLSKRGSWRTSRVERVSLIQLGNQGGCDAMLILLDTSL